MEDSKKKLFPIGTIVKCKDVDTKALIVSRDVVSDIDLHCDYTICYYPEGMALGNACIDNCDIGEIYSLGSFSTGR